MPVPSTNGKRKTNGQFDAGNKYGKGNPYAQKVAQLRTAMIQAITTEDIQEMIKALVNNAKAGCIPSIKILLSYLVGATPQPCNPDHLEIEELETKTKLAWQKESQARRN